MSSLSMVEAKLPAGFRFHPRDDELICDYLMKWVAGCATTSGHGQPPPLLIEVDLNKCEPWDIPEEACVGGKDWYFYNQRDRKYATGLRTNRATISGYWKATGKDRPIIRKGGLVGMRKTLVFYQGRAPKGRKTDWVMHEFRIEEPIAPPKGISPLMIDWVLCKVFNKSKEVSAEQEMGSNCETNSSSLPPLMEPYINFEQSTDEASINEFQQVPCLSIFSTPNQTNPHFPDHHSRTDGQDLSTKMIMPTLGGFSNDLGLYSNPSFYDQRMVTAVLNRLSKTESNPCIKGSPSLGEGSSDSYLSEVGLSSMWNYY